MIDDLVSIEPFIAGGIRIYGVADPRVERVGTVGPGYYMRVALTVSWSWNLEEGEPAGHEWYPTRRGVHEGD